MNKGKVFKSVLLFLLCSVMLFVVYACNDTPEEGDPYEESYGRYLLHQYAFNDELTSNIGFLNFDALAIMVSANNSEEKFEFAKEIKAFVGNHIDFSKEGIKFNGEFGEFVPYRIYRTSNSGFYFDFNHELINAKNLDGYLTIWDVSWQPTFYTISLDTYISFDDWLYR